MKDIIVDVYEILPSKVRQELNKYFRDFTKERIDVNGVLCRVLLGSNEINVIQCIAKNKETHIFIPLDGFMIDYVPFDEYLEKNHSEDILNVAIEERLKSVARKNET